jgi:rod shape-determining protein MreC
VLRLQLRPGLALAVTCLGLYVAAAAQARATRSSALSIAVAAISAPVLALANGVGVLAEDFSHGLRSLQAILAEHTHLEQEAAELRRVNQALSAEVASLRQGSRLLAAYPTLVEKAVVARVIARDVLRTHTLRLDRGRRDGIALDSAVLTENGLLGRVDSLQEHSCRVQLLTHPQAAAAARIAGVAQEALLVGGDQPRITGLPPYTDVPENAQVLSTGSEGIYQPGLVLGSAHAARTDGIFTVAAVELAARASEANTVLVLQPAGRAMP